MTGPTRLRRVALPRSDARLALVLAFALLEALSLSQGPPPALALLKSATSRATRWSCFLRASLRAGPTARLNARLPFASRVTGAAGSGDNLHVFSGNFLGLKGQTLARLQRPTPRPDQLQGTALGPNRLQGTALGHLRTLRPAKNRPPAELKF